MNKLSDSKVLNNSITRSEFRDSKTRSEGRRKHAPSDLFAFNN